MRNAHGVADPAGLGLAAKGLAPAGRFPYMFSFNTEHDWYTGRGPIQGRCQQRPWRVNNLLTRLDRFAVFPRAGTPAPQCGTSVLARQIAENGVQMSKLQGALLATPRESHERLPSSYSLNIGG